VVMAFMIRSYHMYDARALATAYMVGMLQIIAARQRAIDALGAQFDITEFHRLLLSNGAVPMAIMNREVDRWVQEKLGAAG
jgi:uncharacterized protein (DUF885 family)